MLKLSDGMLLYHGGEVGSREADALCIGNFAVDATVALVVEELTGDLSRDANTVLRDFIASKTGALLYDEESKLWWMGPSYIADMYKKEVCGE
ncbi:MAG: hypothetical protein NC180_12840 [Muribaculaceae bacterium]|nr:hypothetical protein [Roseburia sp.]MCM1432285.1 hypothetical protein [Muribaculaceae bacterium]MCM1494089.1 hypothetical protein [Muribaculaceae bacterium]